MNICQYFSVIVAGDDIKTSKPSGDGYLLAVEKINQQNPSLELKPSECLVIEDTPAGIEAGKKCWYGSGWSRKHLSLTSVTTTS